MTGGMATGRQFVHLVTISSLKEGTIGWKKAYGFPRASISSKVISYNSQMLYVWNSYLHLAYCFLDVFGKCRVFQ